MQYRVIKGTVANGNQVKVGDILDLDSYEAKELMAYGKVVPHVATKQEEITIEAAEPQPYQTRVVKRGRPAKSR